MNGRRLVFILVLLGVMLIAYGNSSEITKDRHKRASNQGGKIPEKNNDTCLNANPPCEAKMTCGMFLGKLQCICPGGDGRFRTRGENKNICEDVNECTDDPNNYCLGYDICTNTNGSYICSCKEGYDYKKGDGCQDINECVTGAHKCEKNTSKCVNTVGSHTCKCLDGFEEKQDKCVEIDECKNTTTCPASATCKNTIGSYKCICKSGYKYVLEYKDCYDIDECKEKRCGTDNNMECRNNGGSYSCACKKGFRKDGNTCKDIDECADKNTRCEANMKCINNIGSFNCECDSGYTTSNSEDTECTDLDECKAKTHNCSKQSYCRNTAGGFRCVCPKGYRTNKDGVSCSRPKKLRTAKAGQKTGIVIALVVCSLLVSVLLAIIFMVKKQRKQKKEANVEDRHDENSASENTPSHHGVDVESGTCQQ